MSLPRAALFGRLMREPVLRRSNFYARVLGDSDALKYKAKHAAYLESILNATRLSLENSEGCGDRIAVRREKQYERYVRTVYNSVLRDSDIEIPRR